MKDPIEAFIHAIRKVAYVERPLIDLTPDQELAFDQHDRKIKMIEDTIRHHAAQLIRVGQERERAEMRSILEKGLEQQSVLGNERIQSIGEYLADNM